MLTGGAVCNFIALNIIFANSIRNKYKRRSEEVHIKLNSSGNGGSGSLLLMTPVGSLRSSLSIGFIDEKPAESLFSPQVLDLEADCR